MNQTEPFHSGFAGIIGKPNVGKSTLLNHLVSEKIAATSSRPQTTRSKITGVCHLPGGQIILLDTPGIHQSSAKFNRYMVRASLSTFDDVDLILFMIDAGQKFLPEDQFVLDCMKNSRPPKILLVNKIDLVPKIQLLGLMDEMAAKKSFAEIIPISALHHDGLDRLTQVILNYFPEGPEYFPPGTVTDCPEKFIIAEIIREKVIKQTHMELPYAVAVVVENIAPGRKGMVVVDAVICAEKASQRGILIGEKGCRLKKIGQFAREEIEKRLGSKVYLNLFVKVKKNWRRDDRYLKEFGYTHDSY